MIQKRVYGYARVSTEIQDLTRQKKLIQDYCSLNGYLLVDIITEKISGAKENKQSIAKLMTLDNDDCDLVLVSELSRLSREDNLTKVVGYLSTLIENGLDVIFLDEPNKVYKAHTNFKLEDLILLIVKASNAAEERKKIRERTTTGKVTVICQNPYAFVGQFAPYGFKVIPNPEYVPNKKGVAKSLLAIDEEERKDIEYIFDSVISGKTLHQIAREFNQQGKRTVRNGVKFTESTISKTIRNTLYKGERRYKKQIYQIEPIISADRWELANGRIKDNQLFRGTASKNFNPLRGIIYCPCGYAMILHSNSGSGLFNYQCCKKSSDSDYRKICKNYGLSATFLLNSVWHTVSAYLVGSNYKIKTDEGIKQLEQSNLLLKSRIADLQNFLANTEKAREGKYNALSMTTNKVIFKELESDITRFDDEINNIERQIKATSEEIAKNKTQIEIFSQQATKEQLNGLNELEKAEVYKNVLSRVVYYSHNLLCGFIVIDFKNGTRRIIAINNNGNNRYVLDVPETFKFDEVKRKITISVLPKPNGKKFNLGAFETREYNFKEYIKSLSELDFEKDNFLSEISLEEIDFKGLAVQASYTESEQ